MPTTQLRMSRLKSTIFYLLLFIGLAAFFVPHIAAFFMLDIFHFVNGSDEQFYLSYQGALSTRDMLGYNAAVIVLLLQDWGISGSIQNLIFDMTLPALSALLVGKIGQQAGLKYWEVPFFVFLTLFSCLLFNFVPLQLPTWADDAPIIVYQNVPFPYFIRTPNPQFSCFILFLVGYISYSRKNYWPWLIALPFYYLYVGLSAFYISVVVFLMIVSFKTHKVPDYAAILIAYILTAAVMLAGATVLNIDETMQHYVSTHQLGLPLYVLIAAPLFFLAKQSKRDEPLLRLAFHAIAAVLALANLQVISGFTLVYYNVVNYTLPYFGGVAIALPLIVITRSLNERPNRWLSGTAGFSVFLLSTSILYGVLKTQSFDFDRMAFKIYHGWIIEDPLLKEKAFLDTTHTVIYPQHLAVGLAYSQAKTLAPPGSFFYGHLGRANGKNCPPEFDWIKRSEAFIEKNFETGDRFGDEMLAYTKMYQQYLEEEQAFSNKTMLKYCNEENFSGDQFFRIDAKPFDWVYFP